MTSSHKFVLALGLGLVLNAATASATPFVQIRGFWSVFARSTPDGVSISCSGDASGSGPECEGNVSLHTTVTTPQVFNMSNHGAMVFTNTTDHALTGFIDLLTDNSAFNPGGP